MILAIIIPSILLIISIVAIMIIYNKYRITRAEKTQLQQELSELVKNIRQTKVMSREPGPAVAEPGKAASEIKEVTSTRTKTNALKSKMLSLVEKCGKELNEEDLPRVQQELKAFFDSQEKEPYYKELDLRYTREDRRVVVIGDTHCDYRSLAGIMKKLTLSSYDYFENAYFIFLGDYLDRGMILFEYLLLLTGIKKLLGERCIFLKGNHELISYDTVSRELESMVYPADSCPTLNNYCGSDKEFLEKFGNYFSQLPYYLLLKTDNSTDLLVHGGIARDTYADLFTISHETGEMLISTDESLRPRILDNMIWSDPRNEDFRMQGASSRFEFGRQQFEHFVSNNKIDRIFRSHEPVKNGMKAFYDNRLYTIFSNGGEGNPDTGYQEVINPVFGIIATDGSVRFESIYFKKIIMRNGVSEYKSKLYMEGDANSAAMQLDDLHLNNEFFIINS